MATFKDDDKTQRIWATGTSGDKKTSPLDLVSYDDNGQDTGGPVQGRNGVGNGSGDPKRPNPVVLLVLAFLIAIVPMTYLTMGAHYQTTLSSQQQTKSTETVEAAHEPVEQGTYEIVTTYDTTHDGDDAIGIVYTFTGDDGEVSEKTVTLTADKVSFEPSGADNTVTIYETTYDDVEKGTENDEQPVVVEEGVKTEISSAIVHYNPDKRKTDVYELVSLEKQGNSLATLKYEEAPGITDEVSISPSTIEVKDDGTGIVERIEEYDEGGQWHVRWVVHSLN